jgi:hypothetical protein
MTDIQSNEHVPLVSSLYLDKGPVLMLVKHMNKDNKKMYVLRLWQSYIKLKETTQPLWVGAVEIVPRTYSWLFHPTRANDVNLAPSLLFSKTPKDLRIKSFTVKTQGKRIKERQMLLIRPATKTNS